MAGLEATWIDAEDGGMYGWRREEGAGGTSRGGKEGRRDSVNTSLTSGDEWSSDLCLPPGERAGAWLIYANRRLLKAPA